MSEASIVPESKAATEPIQDYFEYAQSGYRIYSLIVLTEEQIVEIVALLGHKVTRGTRVLEGRADTRGENINGLGRIFVKHYARGGLLRLVISDRFYGESGGRAKIELEMLLRVNKLGLRVPKPIAYVVQGGRLYCAWLVLEELQGYTTLAQISREEEETVHRVFDDLVRQIGILLDNKIFHVDLHPGNVLVGPQRELYLIDFDKAHTVNIPRPELRERYLRRWRRAVIKHGLSPLLNELMSLKLRCANG